MAELMFAANPLAGAGLSARAADVARRVADVVQTHCSTGSGAAETVAFLREWADSNGPGYEPQVGPLDLLAMRFDLTPEECDLVLLAGLPDEHEGVASTMRSLHPLAEPWPTVGLAALVLGGTGADRVQLRGLLSDGAAVRHRLVHVVGTGSFFERSLLLPDRLWDALHGYDAWPADLPRVLVDPPPPGLASWLRTDQASAAIRILREDRKAVVIVQDDDETVGRARCSALARAAGRELAAARIGVGDGPRIALLAAHAAARGAVAMIVAAPPVDGSADRLAVADAPGAILVCAAPGAVRAAPDRAVLALVAGPVGAHEQLTAWRAAVPALAGQASMLAARHPLDPAVTAQLAIDVRELGRDVGLADVSALIRTRAAASLPTGVQLVTPRVPWGHLVLPAESALQLRDAVTRLDHQSVVLDDWGLRERAHASRGARLLLTGPPGTGKSLAAAAVATAAQTDLLIVDVSRVVSKWLGETEKNLAAAFEAAERTQSVLLLDEADALFGARTEISDAHDRYANLETAYLLQRLDRFEGLAILTTNLRANIDGAFIRRMDFVVEFPLPDESGRVELWTRHLPSSGLADDTDPTALARLYPVPGAWIRNAAVAAAFGAAAERGRITQQHLVTAMRREYAKVSLPFPGEPPRRRHEPV